jgi:hypothetical protein
MILTMGSVMGADESPYLAIPGNINNAIGALTIALDKVLPQLDLIDTQMAIMDKLVGEMEKEKKVLKQVGRAVQIADEAILPLVISFTVFIEPLLTIVDNVMGIIKVIKPEDASLKAITDAVVKFKPELIKLPETLKAVKAALPAVKKQITDLTGA